ncbi:hypothetical protein TorRG33x02_300770 [Trema orientale]|uniref:RNase H type-1 domain-containing protein n=1 Tax=Trema orientale TaxID=63057 RepID=A0A2P5C1P0_TREOI|nr:hypothetical protein TorRG33x02_300770 [Trema orientale]
MRELMPFFSQVVVTFVSKECNYYAHNLASWAYACNSFDTLNPSEVPAAVCQDHFQWSYVLVLMNSSFIKNKNKKKIRGIFHIIDVLILLTLSMPR